MPDLGGASKGMPRSSGVNPEEKGNRLLGGGPCQRTAAPVVTSLVTRNLDLQTIIIGAPTHPRTSPKVFLLSHLSWNEPCTVRFWPCPCFSVLPQYPPFTPFSHARPPQSQLKSISYYCYPSFYHSICQGILPEGSLPATRPIPWTLLQTHTTTRRASYTTSAPVCLCNFASRCQHSSLFEFLREREKYTHTSRS